MSGRLHGLALRRLRRRSRDKPRSYGQCIKPSRASALPQVLCLTQYQATPQKSCGSELARDEADMFAGEISRDHQPSSFVLDTNLATPQIPCRSAACPAIWRAAAAESDDGVCQADCMAGLYDDFVADRGTSHAPTGSASRLREQARTQVLCLTQYQATPQKSCGSELAREGWFPASASPLAVTGPFPAEAGPTDAANGASVQSRLALFISDQNVDRFRTQRQSRLTGRTWCRPTKSQSMNTTKLSITSENSSAQARPQPMTSGDSSTCHV